MKKVQKKEEFRSFFGSLESLIKVELIPSRTVLSQSIEVVSDTEILLKINFQKPNKSKEKVRITLDFADFIVMGNKTIELSLEKLVGKKKKKETSSIEKGGKAALQAATGASLIINFLMNGALSRVWGMINGMQMIVHVPLFNIEMPKSAIAVTSILIDVATFDVPYINVVDIFGASNLRNSTEVFKPDILADDNNNE